MTPTERLRKIESMFPFKQQSLPLLRNLDMEVSTKMVQASIRFAEPC